MTGKQHVTGLGGQGYQRCHPASGHKLLFDARVVHASALEWLSVTQNSAWTFQQKTSNSTTIQRLTGRERGPYYWLDKNALSICCAALSSRLLQLHMLNPSCPSAAALHTGAEALLQPVWPRTPPLPSLLLLWRPLLRGTPAFPGMCCLGSCCCCCNPLPPSSHCLLLVGPLPRWHSPMALPDCQVLQPASPLCVRPTPTPPAATEALMGLTARPP